MRCGMIGVEDNHHAHFLPDEFAHYLKDFLRDRRPAQISDSLMDGTRPIFKRINSHYSPVLDEITHASAKESAAASISARLNNYVGPDLVNDLLINPEIKGAFQERRPKPEGFLPCLT